jgi:hypothetical protein
MDEELSPSVVQSIVIHKPRNGARNVAGLKIADYGHFPPSCDHSLEPTVPRNGPCEAQPGHANFCKFLILYLPGKISSAVIVRLPHIPRHAPTNVDSSEAYVRRLQHARRCLYSPTSPASHIVLHWLTSEVAGRFVLFALTILPCDLSALNWQSVTEDFFSLGSALDDGWISAVRIPHSPCPCKCICTRVFQRPRHQY